jgi:type I restriction enzyme, S subunit
MSVENKLPEGWVESSYENIIHSMSNGIGGKQNKEGIGIPVSRIETIASEYIDFSRVGYLKDYDISKIQRYKLNEGDILFSHINSPSHLGKTALYDGKDSLYHGINLLRVVVDKSVIKPEFFNYHCKLSRVLGTFSLNAQHAVNQSSLNQKKISEFKLPLPPLAEQQVIADQLDSLLAQVEATKTRLERIPDTLKRFRQSVLADAVSGRLTEEWRSQHKLDSVSDLSSELVLNDGKAKKVESTSGHELMTEIFPPSWEVSTFNLLYRFIDYRGKTPKKSDSGKRLYSAKNIKMGWLSDEPIEYLDESDYTAWMTRGFTNLGDIFFVTEGHTMGCVAINDIGSDIALAQRTLTLQPYGKINTKFHFYYMLTAEFQRLVELNATGSAAKGIKSAKFRGLPAPFPSFKEQNQIVRRVEQLFAYADRVELQANAALVQVSQLTQSILAKAFRGELTAGWRAANPELVSGDNSAVALLARIKEERAAVVRSGRKIKAEV